MFLAAQGVHVLDDSVTSVTELHARVAHLATRTHPMAYGLPIARPVPRMLNSIH